MRTRRNVREHGSGASRRRPSSAWGLARPGVAGEKRPPWARAGRAYASASGQPGRPARERAGRGDPTTRLHHNPASRVPRCERPGRPRRATWRPAPAPACRVNGEGRDVGPAPSDVCRKAEGGVPPGARRNQTGPVGGRSASARPGSRGRPGRPDRARAVRWVGGGATARALGAGRIGRGLDARLGRTRAHTQAIRQPVRLTAGPSTVRGARHGD